MRKLLGGMILVIAALAAAFIIHAVRLSHTTTVIRIIDATSIRCEDGRSLRLIGLNNPVFSSEEEDGRQYLNRFILHKRVRVVEVRSSPPTKAYVYYGEILVNGRMIRDGYARADAQDDYPERELFQTYEKEAKARGLGIWNDPARSRSSR